MTEQEFSDKLDEVYNTIKPILIAKNNSYGFSVFNGDKNWNITGNCVRLSDKIERYKHLVQNNPKDSPFGETIKDTLLDILGYALIGNIIVNED